MEAAERRRRQDGCETLPLAAGWGLLRRPCVVALLMLMVVVGGAAAGTAQGKARRRSRSSGPPPLSLLPFSELHPFIALPFCHFPPHPLAHRKKSQSSSSLPLLEPCVTWPPICS